MKVDNSTNKPDYRGISDILDKMPLQGLPLMLEAFLEQVMSGNELQSWHPLKSHYRTTHEYLNQEVLIGSQVGCEILWSSSAGILYCIQWIISDIVRYVAVYVQFLL